MRTIRVGLLGVGTVGGGVACILARNGGEIARRLGQRMEIVRAACRRPDNINAEVKKALAGASIHTDAMEVVTADDVDIVVELIGEGNGVLALIKSALSAGRPVVTANKALLAKHGDEIFALARKNGVGVAYEASVMGGVPIIQVLRESLAANRIERLVGIINGTCNYILSRMRLADMEYEDALKEAQELGYAEASPELDVGGIDAAHKLAIMAAISFGTPLSYDSVSTEGIEKIRKIDMCNAEAAGHRIRHIGVARRSDAGLELRVHPALIPSSHLLASVDGVMNAVEVVGDAVGPTLYCGAGAGGGPTASAVVADLIETARTMTTSPELRTPGLAFQDKAVNALPVVPLDNLASEYYVRMMVTDKAGVLSALSSIFAERDISIRMVTQHEAVDEHGKVPLIFMTHEAVESNIRDALATVEKENDMASDVLRLRVESFSE